MSRTQNKLQSKCLSGEATPRYLHYPHAPKRIFSMLPNVKLIVLLRNPIDRAYSHYQMEVDSGHEKLSFEDAISNEEEKITNDMKKMESDENFYSVNFYRKSYTTRGIYVTQLERWFKYFPIEQFMILKSEDLYSNPSKIYKQVLDFLDLPKHELNSFKAHRMRKYNSIESETRIKLNDYFKPYNEKLYKLLGRDFDWK